MNTLFSLTSHSIRVFFQTADTQRPSVDTEVGETPREGISTVRRQLVGLAVAASLTALAPSVYAQATKTGEQVAVTVAKTSDGRDFASLTPEDVKKLPRAEKEVYYEWRK